MTPCLSIATAPRVRLHAHPADNQNLCVIIVENGPDRYAAEFNPGMGKILPTAHWEAASQGPQARIAPLSLDVVGWFTHKVLSDPVARKVYYVGPCVCWLCGGRKSIYTTVDDESELDSCPLCVPMETI